MNKPLSGKTVLITRARGQESKLKVRLEALGANTLHVPALRFLRASAAPLDKAIRALQEKKYDWVVFTSQNGVEFFFKRLKQLSLTAKIFRGIQVAVIGPATHRPLSRRGVSVALTAKQFVAESLFEELEKSRQISGRRFLLLRGDLARPYLRRAINRGGGEADEVIVYRTVRDISGRRRLKKILGGSGVDFIPFTSSSNVESLMQMAGPALLHRIAKKAKIVSIGPITSKTLRKHGLSIARQAKRFDIQGIVEAIEQAARKGK
ncbi:MAG: uroporphyrinogen-III synthase [Candidatus Omnitrophica bacterium]|nr:uroporphyrinogen-III synthase [Candidatus Omnitrophota bacterium]